MDNIERLKQFVGIVWAPLRKTSGNVNTIMRLSCSFLHNKPHFVLCKNLDTDK